MSLLVPDYSSSSEDEAAPPTVEREVSSPAPARAASNEPSAASGGDGEPAKPTKKKASKKKTRKPKTTLFLPPEIQKLFESGTLGDSDDEDENSLLVKQKRAVAKHPRAKDENPEQKDGSLSFLPAPKHQLEKPKQAAPTPAVEIAADTNARITDPSVAQPVAAGADQTYDAAAYQQYYQQYDPQQYAQYYQQYQQQQGHYVHQQEDTEPSSKRTRHRDRELERMLQMGQFDSVADKIVEVSAPAPDAWQAPPPDELKKGSASDVKLKASFWNSSAGTAVASVKPSRLQRQKHQLNQLAFDAKAREFELLDRKGAAIKTKRETHAKYGW